MLKLKPTTRPNTFQVEGELTVHEVEQFYQKLLKKKKQIPTLTLDVAKLTGIDTAGTQLLLSLKKSGGTILMKDCPQPVLQILQQVNLDNQLS